MPLGHHHLLNLRQATQRQKTEKQGVVGSEVEGIQPLACPLEQMDLGVSFLPISPENSH